MPTPSTTSRKPSSLPRSTVRDKEHAMIITPDLKDKVALVTGASRGIGAAIAVALAQAGAAVAVNYRERTDAADALVADLGKAGHRAISIAADVSQAVVVTKMVETVTAALGPVDILVNNAGLAI